MMAESSDMPQGNVPDLAAPTSPDEWVKEYGDALFRYALAKVSQVPLAEDLVQETFLAAWQGREAYAGSASPLTWMIGILRHKIVDEFRRQGRVATAGLDPEAEPANAFTRRGHWQRPIGHWPRDPQSLLENREFWEVLDRCVDKLPANLASVFQLREIEQVDTNSLCGQLEISPANASVRLYRARALLRRCLEMTWFTAE